MTDLLNQLNIALADRYRLERELGRGGMATVYLAQDVRHRRRVALKVLHRELAYALGPDRFLREIEVAANLTHPHILPLHDSGEAAGLLYYVMPYVDGESLRGRLIRETQLPVDEALQIAREVADALAHAHGHGVIHRDIMPENILLSGGHALVADFGIARALGQAGAEQLTEAGMAVGTAAYMSPVQASGERQVDGRSDIYSLGCILYEMLAGEPPYTGPTAQAIVAFFTGAAQLATRVVAVRVQPQAAAEATPWKSVAGDADHLSENGRYPVSPGATLGPCHRIAPRSTPASAVGRSSPPAFGRRRRAERQRRPGSPPPTPSPNN